MRVRITIEYDTDGPGGLAGVMGEIREWAGECVTFADLWACREGGDETVRISFDDVTGE